MSQAPASERKESMADSMLTVTLYSSAMSSLAYDNNMRILAHGIGLVSISVTISYCHMMARCASRCGHVEYLLSSQIIIKILFLEANLSSTRRTDCNASSVQMIAVS